MAKRKNSSLDDFVLKYLKENGMKKSHQMLLERKSPVRTDYSSFSKTSKNFQDFQRSEKQFTPNDEQDDLGFEINFDIFQAEGKYPVGTKTGTLAEKSKRTRQKTDKTIPKGLFQLRHI